MLTEPFFSSILSIKSIKLQTPLIRCTVKDGIAYVYL